MRNALFLLLSLSFFAVNAQDDPFAVLEKNTKPTTTYATATFKATRVINGHSVETMKKKHLDFRIAHRFGSLFDPNSGGGAYNYFGMDQATMRMSFEYGLTDNLMIGIGRSTTNKTFDYFAKMKLLKQSSGLINMPVSITVFGSIAAVSLNSSASQRYYENLERLTYCGQILIARKISESLSLQISPTYLHRNKVFKMNSTDVNEVLEPNDIFSVGIGGRIKISKRTSINAEYFYVLPSTDSKYKINANHYPALSVGVDIETGGHVFQLHFTNSLGMIEKQFIAENTETWSNGGIHYGFNLSRTFSFDRQKKIAN